MRTPNRCAPLAIVAVLGVVPGLEAQVWELGNEMLQTIFTGATGHVFTVGVQGQGLAVGKIGAIRPGDAGQIAQATEMGRVSFTRDVFKDIEDVTRAYAKDTIKPKANRDRAIRALGLDPKEYAEKTADEKDGKAKGAVRSGGFKTLPIREAPSEVVRLATRASNAIGNGLYGVDLKQSRDRTVIIEVNDNPSIDAGVEDAYLGEDLYRRIMEEFLRRLERKRLGVRD